MSEPAGRAVTFSVLAGAYRNDAYINAFIASVRSQSRADWELIIVDDASPDNVGDRVRAHKADDRIVYLRHEVNRGCSAARNTAAAGAQGRYLVFVDSDDVLHPDFLAHMHEAVVDLPQLAVASCVNSYIDAQGRAIDGPPAPPPTDGDRESLFLDVLRSPFVYGPVMVFQRDVFMEIGRYNERATFGEDFELWLRAMASGGAVVVVPDAMYAYRMHDQSLTFDPAREIENYEAHLRSLDLLAAWLPSTELRAAALRQNRRHTEQLLEEARYRMSLRDVDSQAARNAARRLVALRPSPRTLAKYALASMPQPCLTAIASLLGHMRSTRWSEPRS